MPDLEAAAAHPARVVVDSTAATPVYLRPLEHGADFALHSATKYLTGHSDALAGAIVCRDSADHERLWRFRQRTGPTCSADVAALVTRGIKTLRVRIERQTETRRRCSRSGCAATRRSRTSATPASVGCCRSTSTATRCRSSARPD